MNSARPTGPDGDTCQVISTAETKSNSTTATELRASARRKRATPAATQRDQPREAAGQLEGADKGAAGEILDQTCAGRPLRCRKPI